MARKLRGCQKLFEQTDWRRQIKTAGSSSVSQRRLRSNSISYWIQNITKELYRQAPYPVEYLLNFSIQP